MAAAVVAFFAVSLAVGCGSKTGLAVPDASMQVETDGGPTCIELPKDGDPVQVALQTEAQLARADVVFLVDVTASMQEEIDRIRDQLRDRLIPAVESEIPDSEFSVATFADFPVEPYGGPEDHAFRMVLPMTGDAVQVQAAVDGISLGNGWDEPESQVEALYQLVTGEGLGSYVPPSFGCASGGSGYACFRRDALPIVLLFTDAPMHNGPGGSRSYGGFVSPRPHSYDDALAGLQQLGARVIGFDSGAGQAAPDLRRVAGDTEAFAASGEPLVYEIGQRGERLGTGVVDAIKTFANTVRFDIDLALRDLDPSDDIDAPALVERVIPVSASPMENIGSIDPAAGAFRDVLAGTQVQFELQLRNDVVVPGSEPQRVQLQIVFRGDERNRLGTETIEIVIPAADGRGC